MPLERYPVIPGAEAWSSPGSGDNARTGVIVIHGFSGNPTSTRGMGERFAEEGYAVEVVRLPGHGTHWRDMARTRYSDWKRELERALTDLRQRTDDVVLVGLSLGATLGLDVAADRPDDVAGIVAINVTIVDRPDPLAKLAPYLQHVIPAVPAAMAKIKKNDASKPGVDEKAYPMVPAKAGYSVVKELPRLRAKLAQVTQPVLIVYSENDHTAYPESSKRLPEMLGSDDVTTIVAERSYHLIPLDWDADILLDSAVNFIGRVTGRKGASISSS